MDHETSIHELKEKVKQFCEARDWDQFHNAKDLAIGVITEASELLEPFRWKSEAQIKEMLANPKKKTKIEEEVADVMYFLMRFAQMNNIDISEALNKKMNQNNEKYPIEKYRGSNLKYNEL